MRHRCPLGISLVVVSAFTSACGGAPDATAPQDGGATYAPPEDGGLDATGIHDAASDEVTHTDVGPAPPPGDASDSSTVGTMSGPIDLSSAAIYAIYPSIFSQDGTLAAVTTQLPRIKALGFNVVWLMPVTPIGEAVNGHPSYGSPYSVHDYGAVNPSYGASSDLVTLVSTAHGLGVKVVLDEVINHTSWDNALITQHPEYYVHSDGNPQNVASIEQAFIFQDCAQLDYKSQNGLAEYITQMLKSWITTYDVDGFRFDTADNPYGDQRMIPAAFWQALRPALESTKPGFLMLGEEEDPGLADAPFELDYGWTLQGQYGAGGLKQVATGGAATLLQAAWQAQSTGDPSSMRHMTLLQDWDMDEDLSMYGGVAQTMAAAAFNFTVDGVPLLFNGEEVGNEQSGNNTHTLIDWNGANATSFSSFYTSLLALRNGSSALQQGALTWVSNSAASSVVSFTRSDASGTFLVLVSFSGSSQTGTVAAPAASGWTDVSPIGSPGGTTHPTPPTFSLSPYDFAIFRAR